MGVVNRKVVTVEEARYLLSCLKGNLDDPFASDLKNIQISERTMRFVAVLFSVFAAVNLLVSWNEPFWRVLVGTAVYLGIGFFAISRWIKLAKLRRFLEASGVQNLSELKADENEP